MRILHFIHGLNIGGAESFIRNEIQAMSSMTDYTFEFAIQNPNITNTELSAMVRKDQIHILPAFPRKPLSQYRALLKLLKSEHYDVVHIHANALVNPIPLQVCNKLSQLAVIHSHSTKNGGGKQGLLIHNWNRRKVVASPNFKRIACSTAAGEWMFGQSLYRVVYNSIDIKRFLFNDTLRSEIRRRYGVDDDTVLIGSVGRVTPPKKPHSDYSHF